MRQKLYGYKSYGYIAVGVVLGFFVAQMIPKAREAFYDWRATSIRVALSTEEEQEIKTFVTKFFDDIKADKLEDAFQMHRESQSSWMFNEFKHEWISYKQANGNIQSIRFGAYAAYKRRFSGVYSVMISVDLTNTKKKTMGELKLSRVDNQWQITSTSLMPWPDV